MVLVCRDGADVVEVPRKAAFIIIIFEAADEEGRGRIHAHHMNVSVRWRGDWRRTFAKWESTLHTSMEVYEDTQTVHLT